MEQGHEIMVSQSYSKNLGLYGERVGAINVVCNDKETADKCDIPADEVFACESKCSWFHNSCGSFTVNNL